MHFERGNLSRRGFIAHTLGGLTAAGLPLWYAQELTTHADEKTSQRTAAGGANGKLKVGVIGTGTNRTRRKAGEALRGERGVAIMNQAMMAGNNVDVVAVCDVDRENANFAANVVMKAQGHEPRKFGDFRELLADRSIDTVLIGTPDHWHALVAIAAMKAGKDVYCEKPLTLTLEEGKAVVKVARETGKIVQTGSQQRSEMKGMFRLACELVRNNRLGKLQKITTLIGDNPQGGPFKPAPVPEGLNWDFWLGPTPRVEYVPERCFYEFRWWYEYSGGKMTDWGAHHNDIAQWALGMDDSGPTSIRGRGEQPTSREPNSYNCHKDFEITYTYGNPGKDATTLLCRANPPMGWNIRNGAGLVQNNGILFEGDGGKWIFVNRSNLFASDPKLIDEPLPATATRLWPEPLTNHMANFLEGVRKRTQPICPPMVGHRSCSVCHLGNIALKLGQTLTWDPREERFTGMHAEEANRQLGRAYREPWKLEA